MSDTSMLYTTVLNPLGSSHTYGYLGYHGRTLAAGAQYSQFGSLADGVGRANKPTRLRWVQALQRDLNAGRIIILHTPSVILLDATSLAVKALRLNGGTLGVVDPSWGAYTA